MIALLESRKIPLTTWAGWYRLDEHERALGAAEGRERIKVVEREEMLAASGAGQGLTATSRWPQKLRGDWITGRPTSLPYAVRDGRRTETATNPER